MSLADETKKKEVYFTLGQSFGHFNAIFFSLLLLLL